jgi:RimJ/RimL family protein N-acetyltransferase
VAVLRCARLALEPITIELVEAVMAGRRQDAEQHARARMPERWPNRELIEQAFALSMDGLRANPGGRLWGARMMVTGGAEGGDRDVIGSVVFRGEPDAHGVAEVAYGVDPKWQGRGYATEAVGASVAWALVQPHVRSVQAVTFAWHRASVRVLEKVGMQLAGARQHEVLGEMLLYERAAIAVPAEPR